MALKNKRKKTKTKIIPATTGGAEARTKRKGEAAKKKKVRTKNTQVYLEKKEKTKTQKKTDGPSHIIGIGASAGGLDAFERFFRNMPSDSGMAFVLVPHLSPSHKSYFGDLLQKHTDMEVIQARNNMRVQEDHVYVIPPNSDLSIFDGHLHLSTPESSHGVRHPIDFFFRSLAQDRGESAVCIVLSGTGTEGAQGLKDIKGAGGLVLVQSRDSAQYDGMPRSAIATGLVDFVLPPDEMPSQLVKYKDRHRPQTGKKSAEPTIKPTEALQKIFLIIRSQTGHDFSQYKFSTINRRIERRMTIHQIENIYDYATFLRNNPYEVSVLFKELLIRVTNFFRDIKAFDVLKQKVFPGMFEDRSTDEIIRVWVPGCSTGEEAYSIAIALHEYMNEIKNNCKVQIFATDLDDESIDKARAGVYPDSISVDISKGRLKDYFTKGDDTYIVRKKIREMITFAVHNIVKDPPFSRIDLVSCRNLLIYLGSELQQQVIPLFHYSLKPGGVLFLGASETIGPFVDLFALIDKKWKIYRSKAAPSVHFQRPMFAPTVSMGPVREDREFVDIEKKPVKINLGEFAEKKLLNEFAPSSVIVDEKGDILYIHGRTGKYLEPAPGKARLNAFDMAREGLDVEMRSAVRRTISSRKDLKLEEVRVKTNSKSEPVNIHLTYIKEPDALRGLVMIVFEEIPPSKRRDAVPGVKKVRQGKRLSDLEMELRSTKEQLRTTIEELEASNEELQSANEELQSANEELQSTNEELETSREELQSVNEELVTVNAESQTKIDELMELGNDMNNLLNSTQIATIFLDNNLNIKRFTPNMKNVMNLIQSDVSRPINDITTNLTDLDMERVSSEVLDTLIPIEQEIQDIKGSWYSMRVLPYRTTENAIDGVVITFNEVTAQKEVQQQLADALEYSEGIIQTVREPLIVLDSELLIVSVNTAFYRVFQTSEEETVGRFIYEIGNQQWDIPDLRKLLDDILTRNTSFRDYVVEHEFPHIGIRKMVLNARRIFMKGKGTEMILLAIEYVESR